MNDCRFGVSPVNYPDPDPDPDPVFITVKCLKSIVNFRIKIDLMA